MNLYRRIAVAGYQAYCNSLVGNPAPKVERYYKRASKPQVGDLVVEASTIWHPDWTSAAIGVLVDAPREKVQTEEEWRRQLEADEYWDHPGESYDIVPDEQVYYINPLDPGQQRPYRWHNASFIAIPYEPIGTFDDSWTQPPSLTR